MMKILCIQLEKVSELFGRKCPAWFKTTWKIISLRILAYGTVHQNFCIVGCTVGNIFYFSEKGSRGTMLVLM